MDVRSGNCDLMRSKFPGMGLFANSCERVREKKNQFLGLSRMKLPTTDIIKGRIKRNCVSQALLPNTNL